MLFKTLSDVVRKGFFMGWLRIFILPIPQKCTEILKIADRCGANNLRVLGLVVRGTAMLALG